MRRLLGRAAALLAAACLLCTGAFALSARRAAVMDALTGDLLFQKDAGSEGRIASTTKIMTGLLICERCDLGQTVCVSPDAVGAEGSSLYLRAGERVTVEELLYGLMLHSGNDAALALAIHCSGSTERFVAEMNARARQLGLRHTHFANPHGLDAEGHYASAEDLARLACEAMRNETFRRVVSTGRITVGTRSFVNHNKLLGRYDGACGVKTGYTKTAGRILVSAAERMGRTIVAVTMDAPDDWRDHAALLDDAFAQYRETTVVHRGECLGQTPLLCGGSVQLVAAADFAVGLREGESVSVEASAAPVLWDAPQPGTPAGSAEITINHVPVGTIPLEWSEKR